MGGEVMVQVEVEAVVIIIVWSGKGLVVGHGMEKAVIRGGIPVLEVVVVPKGG